MEVEMMYFTTAEIERFLLEDMPFQDLTTDALQLSGACTAEYFTRENGVVSGLEEVQRLADLLGVDFSSTLGSGAEVSAGDTLCTARGPVRAVFALWKVGQNILDTCSGIATRAHEMRTALRVAGLSLPLLVTRKVTPGAKKLMVKAALDGGAVAHRMGVSETILVFGQHIQMAGGVDAFVTQLPRVKRANIEKKIIVETSDPHVATRVLAAGADGIQFDKVPTQRLATIVKDIHEAYPNSVLLAAGGVNPSNCVEYGQTGVNGLVTTSIYHAPPLDIGVRINRS
ncbi:ModD protein [Gleimia hominis]|uniref:Putative pyrophosphorylase ModD n=1 Tax=Gleimia hominis TaxID=595468 RepID=A0ABU3I971_9ACTO|nr:ModD protein [Gleimia hominis]MDT3766919.1 ModD protein [Gleimia hominis]